MENTGFKVKYGSLMQTACSGARIFKGRISTFKKRDKGVTKNLVGIWRYH